MTLPLEGRNALVLGVERPAGRRVAVALAEAGADVAVVTLSEDTQAEFAASSTANEFWALGRRGFALTTMDDQHADSKIGADGWVINAIRAATVALGPISILVWHSPPPLPRKTLSGLRSDPAIVVLVGDDESTDDARALLTWTQELASAGLRANALVASRTIADAAKPTLKEHHPPEPLDVAHAAAYLASDATAAIEGAMVVAEEI